MKYLKNIISKGLEGLKLFIPIALLLCLSSCGDDCKTVEEYKSNGLGENCLLCGLFKIVNNASANAANTSWDLFAKSLIPIVALTTAIYIAIATFKNLGSFSKQDIANYLSGDKNGIIQLLFKSAVIIALLNESLSGSLIINDVIKPLMEGSLQIGLALTSQGSSISIDTGASSLSGWSGLFTMLNDFIKAFSDSIYEVVAIGISFMCHATSPDFFLYWFWFMLFIGFILYCFGWILLYGISFFMIDLVIRLAIGAILLPFGVAAVISSQTSGYTKNIWNVFVNVFFSFIILGIVVGVTIQLIFFSLGRDVTGNGGPKVENALSSFLNNLDANLSENDIEALSDGLKESGSLILLIVCFYVISKLVEGLSKLVDNISETEGITSVGSQALGEASKPLVENAKKAGTNFVGFETKKNNDGTFSYGIKDKSVLGAIKGTANRTNNTFGRVFNSTKFGKNVNNKIDKLDQLKGKLIGSGKYAGTAWWRK